MQGRQFFWITVLTLHLGVTAFSDYSALRRGRERRGVLGVKRRTIQSILVHKLEKVLPILANLAVDLPRVLHLADKDLTG